MTIWGVSRRLAYGLLGLMGAASLAIIGMYADAAYLRHAHANNIVQAEQFKRDVEARFPAGTPLDTVDTYLATKPVVITRANPRHGDEPEYRVTVIKGRSPHWYCGTEEVGVILYFSNEQRLVKAEATSWSFDCL